MTHSVVTRRQIHGLAADLPLQVAIIGYGPAPMLSGNDLVRFLDIPHDRPAFIRRYLDDYHFVAERDYHHQVLEPDQPVNMAPELIGRATKEDYLLTLPCAHAFCVILNTPLAHAVARWLSECQIAHKDKPEATVDVAIVQDELWKARPLWQRIHALKKDGHTVKEIARELRRSRRKIGHAIERMRMTGLLVKEGGL